MTNIGISIKALWKLIRNKQRRKQILDILSNPSMQSRILNNYSVSDNNTQYLLLEPQKLLESFPDLKKLKFAFVGGCEFEYAHKILTELGLNSYHTFTDAGATNPYLELTSENSKIWEIKPDIVVFSVSDIIRKVLKNIQERSTAIDAQNASLKEIALFVKAIAKILREKLNAIAFVVSYDLLYRPSEGLLDYKRQPQIYSLSEFTRRFELQLFDAIRNEKNIYLLDLSELFAFNGKINNLQLFEDNAYWTHYNRAGAQLIVGNLFHQLIAIQGIGKRIKCIVMDLDNTLWEGILRDDGPNKLRLRHDRLYILKLLKARGIMITICSKNDPTDQSLIENILNVKEIGVLYDVPNPFADEVYPYKDLFVLKKINWQEKAQNIQDIAKELNIGLDAIAVFDDNPFEREQIKHFLPMVEVFPEWALKDALLLPEFEPLPETKESAKRSEMMQADQIRTAEAEKFQGDKESFLKSCQMKLWIRKARTGDINRVFEMIQRTNQLNTTTKRYALKEIENLQNSDQSCIFIADLVDKYGEYGTIGLAIVIKEHGIWTLDTFLFSCRIMGKTVEKTMLLYIMQQALTEKASKVIGKYRKTEKNQLMEKFFGEAGFSIISTPSDEQETIWEYDLSKKPIEPYPNWFEFVK